MVASDERRKKSRSERLAELTWKAKRERIVRDFGEERNRVINRVTHSGNVGGYLPALIQWAVERLKASISAQADAYIEAFNAFHLPCDETAEKKLWQAASEFAAGSIMNVRNDRSVKRHRLGLGSPWHLEVEREMHTSAKEAIARLRHQRAAVTDLEGAGLPYGAYPRLILVWMTTEALRTGERKLELGRSLSSFMGQLGLQCTGGHWGTIPRFREQMERLAVQFAFPHQGRRFSESRRYFARAFDALAGIPLLPT